MPTNHSDTIDIHVHDHHRLRALEQSVLVVILCTFAISAMLTHRCMMIGL